MNADSPAVHAAPRLGEGVPLARMPAHWMLARLGKKVMRPGGLAPSLALLDALQITSEDDVVDLWPGLGITTERTLAAHPRSYTAIERGAAEAARVERLLTRPEQRSIIAPVHRTGLETGSASVVYGEALLTLDVPTFLSDEGILGSIAFLGRCLAHPSVLPRIAQMWRTFHRYRDSIGSSATLIVKRSQVQVLATTLNACPATRLACPSRRTQPRRRNRPHQRRTT